MKFKSIKTWLIVFLIPLAAQGALGEICSKRNVPAKISGLNKASLPQANGLAASYLFPQRLYQITAMDNGVFLYSTNERGGDLEKIEIANLAGEAIEELAVGSCGEETCLFIADIGDEKRNRSSVEIILLKEEKNFATVLPPFHRLKLKYPDHPHDAEAMVIAPNGDLFIITKEHSSEDRRAEPAEVFHLSKADVLSNSTETLKRVGTIDVPWLAFEFGIWGQMITSAAMSHEGKSLVLLTDDNLIELAIPDQNLASLDVRSMALGKDYQITDLAGLAHQKKAVTFRRGTGTLLFNSGSDESEDTSFYRIECATGIKTGYAAAAKYMHGGPKKNRGKKRKSKSRKRK